MNISDLNLNEQYKSKLAQGKTPEEAAREVMEDNMSDLVNIAGQSNTPLLDAIMKKRRNKV